MRLILLALTLLPTLTFAQTKLELPDAGFESKTIPPTGWEIFEYGSGGQVSLVKSTDDAAEGSAAVSIGVAGGGGGQGIFTDLKLKAALKDGEVIRFSAKARVADRGTADEGSTVNLHVEFLAKGKVVMRGDTLQTAAIIHPDHSEETWEELVSKHEVDINHLPAGVAITDVDTVRFVIVAVQSDNSEEDGDFGTVVVDEVAASRE